MADSVVEVAAAPMAAEVEEEVEAVGGADAPEDDAADEITNLSGDHKRKLEDLEPRDDEEEAPLKKQEVSANKSDADGLGDGSGIHSTETLVAVAEQVKSNNVESAEPKIEGSGAFDVKVGAQEPLPTVEINDSVYAVGADTEKELQISETPTVGNDQISPGQNAQSTTVLPADSSAMSRKIEVPNNKVGVLIGKAGETIKYLQFNSGTKIQIMRDAEADPHSSTRLVELIGTLESINKAEKLIKDVIAEADAGGSPSLVARGFSTLQSGGEQFEIRVPNEKVGLIIGKGGETIKILQTRSGARIQLIPQHLLEGDASKERTVRITGDKKQIVSAKEMIKEVMNQVPIRPSPLSGYSRQNYRPRGPSAMPHWGSQARAPAQPTMGYEYQQRGTYPPPQMSQYPQPYGSYTQQPAPRGSYSSAGWEERAVAPVHSTPTGRYDYYGQGSLASGTPASLSNPIPGTTPAPVSYGQSQAPNYGHPSPYGQPVPAQQNYGQGYNDPRYDSCLPNQQLNGQQTMASQPGVYGQGTAPQSGFSQQHSYTKPGYGVPPQEGLPSYGVPSKASQPGDATYQGLALSSYGSGTMTQKYPFGSNAPSQPAPSYNQTYGPASGAMDGYTQPPSAAYNQYGGQSATPGYVQGGQPVPAPAYAQPSSQPAGYGQYTSSQQGYGDPGSSNVNYGYHGEFAGAAYGNTFPGSGHGAPPAGGNQPGHAQQPLNLAGYYDQTAIAQTGYGSHPGNAPK